MNRVDTIEALEALYDAPVPASLTKVAARMTPLYRQWIEAARFVVLSTVGPEGTDGSPRGDDGSVVRIVDEKTLLLPDWRGNNRIDSLRNIVRDGRISITFMVPGSANVVRVNGRARLSTAPDLAARFRREGAGPRCVIVIAVAEVYIQCARAILRAGLWEGGAAPDDLPSVGDILSERTGGALVARDYDLAWSARAPGTLW